MTYSVSVRSFISVIFVCCLTATSHSQDAQMANANSLLDSIERVDALFSEFDDQTPGVSIAVMRDEKVVLKKSYGCKDVQERELINSKTVFSLASVSKQFTAFAVLLLESEGKLTLDDDVRVYVPELPDYGNKITLRHLANHTSGLRSHLQMFGMKGLNPNDSITREMVLQMIFRQRELNFNPGEQFSYSNSGYSLLAEVVSRVSGLNFADFIQSRVLGPLGMHDSYVVEDFNKPVENLATAYNLSGGTYSAVPSNDSVVGSSGLFTTIDDLTKWGQNFDHPLVGGQQIFSEMSKLGVLNDGTESNHGMGQFIGIHRDEEMTFHAGADAGFVAFLVRFPQQDLSVMLLGNCSSINAQQKSLQVADCFLVSNGNEALENEEPKEPHTLVKLTPKQLAKIEGCYFDPRNHIARTVVIKDGSLVYSRPEQGGRESILAPLNEHEFCLGASAGVKVVFDVTGSTRTMNVVVDRKIVEQYEEHAFVAPRGAELERFSGHYYSEELDTNYTVGVEDGVLLVTVPVIGQVKLEAIQSDGFCTQGYPFNYLEYSRADNGLIRGFRVSSDRAKNIFFEKRQR